MQAAPKTLIRERTQPVPRKPELPAVDPLLEGPRKGAPFSLPAALSKTLQELAWAEGVRSSSDYVAHALAAVVRQRVAVLTAEGRRPSLPTLEALEPQGGPKKPSR